MRSWPLSCYIFTLCDRAVGESSLLVTGAIVLNCFQTAEALSRHFSFHRPIRKDCEAMKGTNECRNAFGLALQVRTRAKMNTRETVRRDHLFHSNGVLLTLTTLDADIESGIVYFTAQCSSSELQISHTLVKFFS